MSAGALYLGRVAHARLRPKRHRFAYRVFSMLVDLDRLEELDAGLRYFSRNRFNLFSFHDSDFGAGGAQDIAEATRVMLAAHGVAAPARIELLCYPRMLGFVFNPLAVFYCYDAAGALIAVVHEVRNTFGGKHSYLAPVDEGAGEIRHEADKVFHVSPFMEMETRYHFDLARPGERVSVNIRQTDAEGDIFFASFSGVREEMTDAALLRAFRDFPLMTLKVVAGIHYEAARLTMKGMKLLKGAPDPAIPVTVVTAPASAHKEAA